MLVVIGIAAILAALVWTWITRQGRVDELLAQLHDVDPRVRARAGVSIIEDGSRRGAKELRKFLTREPDARARQAVALAVAGRAAHGIRGDFEHWAVAELGDVAAAPGPSLAARPSVVSLPVETAHSQPVAAYAMAEEAAAPGDHSIHWKLEPEA